MPSSVHFIYISCKGKNSVPSVLDTTKHFLLPHLSSNVSYTLQMRQHRLEMLFVSERWDQLLSNAKDVVHCLLQEPIPSHPSQMLSHDCCHCHKGFQQGSPLASYQVCTPIMLLADTVVLYIFNLITLAGYERLSGANTCGRCHSRDSRGAAEPLLGVCQLHLLHWRTLYFEAFHSLALRDCCWRVNKIQNEPQKVNLLVSNGVFHY